MQSWLLVEQPQYTHVSSVSVMWHPREPFSYLRVRFGFIRWDEAVHDLDRASEPRARRVWVPYEVTGFYVDDN